MAASTSTKVTVHKETKRPTLLWNKLKVKQRIQDYTPVDPASAIPENHVRFVCISDTHTKTDTMLPLMPKGDVLLHAGDFSNVGEVKDVVRFSEFLESLPYKHKVVIAGNHDLCFDPLFLHPPSGSNDVSFPQPHKLQEGLAKNGVHRAADLFQDKCIYLEDSGVDLYGIRIWGSPWQPRFYDWGFNLDRGADCLAKWDLIPDDTDVLITHGPPLGRGDMCFDGQRAGCVELLSTVQSRVKPTYHVFGHIHEGYGATTDGHTAFINASTCTLRYKPLNPPIVFDVPLPPGRSKDDTPLLFGGGAGDVDVRLSKGTQGGTEDDDLEVEFREDPV